MKFLKSFFLILCVISLNAFAQNATCETFDSAVKAYNEGEFERAIDEWRACADRGLENADLFYNLGNAYFRNGNLGFSIFYYKKALRLRANDEDILHNLKYAEARTRDKIDEDEENPILEALFKIHHGFPLKVQLFILLGLAWCEATLLLGKKFFPSEKSKNICIALLFICTFIFGIIAASASYKIYVLETERIGVVTAPDADVTSAPNDKSQTLNTLSEGTSFEILNDHGAFVEIRLGEKIRGFVNKKNVGIVE